MLLWMLVLTWSLATNHTLDKGEKGVLNSRKYWNSKEGVIAAGSYSSFEERDKVIVNEKNGLKYAFLSYTTYTTATGLEGIMLIGEHAKQPIAGDIEAIVPWGYMGSIWVSFPPNNEETSCPVLQTPTIMYYNNQFYIFGEKFESFYTSEAGLAWKKANKKFSFPYQDWSEADFKPSKEQPEFRGRETYSSVLDDKNDYIYILFSGGTASFEEEVEDEEDEEKSSKATKTHTYTYESEVWRGRLNQLWFDKDPLNAGK